MHNLIHTLVIKFAMKYVISKIFNLIKTYLLRHLHVILIIHIHIAKFHLVIIKVF